MAVIPPAAVWEARSVTRWAFAAAMPQVVSVLWPLPPAGPRDGGYRDAVMALARPAGR